MSAREDLLYVAAKLAADARRLVDEDDPAAARTVGEVTFESASDMARGAREALQAAQLVDAEPAPIIAATERLHARLAELGQDAGLELAMQFGAAEAIDAVTEYLEELLLNVRVGAAASRRYVALRELLEGLERDFGGAGTETAQRIADRIRVGLDAAEQDINDAKGQEGQGG